VAFEQTADVATLTIDTPAGRYQIEANHVIDATGSASPLRKWLAVPYDSQRGDDRWCIADVRFNTHPPVERHTWIEAPFNDNRAVWQHLMADEVWRIDYQMPPDADPAYVSREDVVRERLARQFGPNVGVDIVWVGPYAYRSECVHHMRAGRVYFLGDSAKVVSPFGARGGNTGVSDADNLAWKLAAVLHGLAAPELLDAYHAERHGAAVENVRVTRRTARFLRAPDGMERLFRTAAISLARQQPFARALINTGRMAVANPYPHSPVCASGTGTSIQNVGFQWADHSRGCLNDLLGWSGLRLLLLVFTPHLSPALCKTLVALTGLTPVSAVQVLPTTASTALPGPSHRAIEHVIDHEGHLGQACSMTTSSEAHHRPAQRFALPHWALIRPDGYLVGRGEGLDGTLIDTIAQALAITALDDPDTTA
jgi:3-(3-hydroxy-phenyl)propionate hydroxylase